MHNNICYNLIACIVIDHSGSEVIMRYLFIVLSQNGDGDGNPDDSEELLLTDPAAVASGASGPLGDSDTRNTLIEWRLFVFIIGPGDDHRIGVWGLV